VYKGHVKIRGRIMDTTMQEFWKQQRCLYELKELKYSFKKGNWCTPIDNYRYMQVADLTDLMALADKADKLQSVKEKKKFLKGDYSVDYSNPYWAIKDVINKRFPEATAY
jgi:hypothetical protein